MECFDKLFTMSYFKHLKCLPNTSVLEFFIIKLQHHTTIVEIITN